MIVAALVPLTIIGLVKVGGWHGLIDEGRATSRRARPDPRTAARRLNNPVWRLVGLVFGLGFVLSFGYWTTNFAEVQRAMSAKSMSAAKRTPIIGAYPKVAHPAVIVIPGIIAAVVMPGSAQRR